MGGRTGQLPLATAASFLPSGFTAFKTGATGTFPLPHLWVPFRRAAHSPDPLTSVGCSATIRGTLISG